MTAVLAGRNNRICFMMVSHRQEEIGLFQCFVLSTFVFAMLNVKFIVCDRASPHMSTKMHFLFFFNHRHLLIVEMVNYLLETLIIEILLSFSIYLL